MTTRTADRARIRFHLCAAAILFLLVQVAITANARPATAPVVSADASATAGPELDRRWIREPRP